MNRYTELISKYLNGELTATEKTAFEAELNISSELKKEYELQLHVAKGAERMGLKNQLNSSFKTVKTKKLLTKALIGVAIALTALGVVLAVKNSGNTSASQINYELNEQGNANWSEADKNLESQVFHLNPERDTIIETQEGIVIAIPAQAFKKANGNATTETIDLEIKEALTAAQIMNAGLSTMSNGRLLETGGMFYINAREGNENLVIAPTKSLNVNVPVNNDKNDMMLFKGERMKDGSINWIDPKPLKRKLSTVDITKLNFYPEHFLDTVKALGFNIKNKKQTDSIYYSFSGYCDIYSEDGNDDLKANNSATVTSVPIVPSNTLQVYANSSSIISLKALPDSTKAFNANKGTCEIDPSRIKAIWNKNFNHTILATKEFEERLKMIFTTCDSRIFNLYVKNLDKNIYEIDSMAANLLSGDLKNKFLGFYSRKDGGVDITDEQNKQLQNYFEEKHTAYIKAMTAALQKMYHEEASKSQIAFAEFIKHQDSETIRYQNNFSQELEINLNEAYRQLGYRRGGQGTPFATHITLGYTPALYSGYISATVTQTGWSNIDRYTESATRNRTTLNYRDPRNGDKVNIAYKPIVVTMENDKNYDHMVCYMIPDKLSSFQIMKQTNNVFRETLNELMGYSIIAIGFKGEQRYYAEIKQAFPQDYHLTLKPIKPQALTQLLNTSFPLNQPVDLAKEIDYQAFDMKETARQNKVAKRETMRYRLLPIVLPCANEPQIERSTPRPENKSNH